MKIKIIRCIFSKEDLSNEFQGCNIQDELVASVPGKKLGVIVLRNGKVTDRWEDGTVGVPEKIQTLAKDIEILYNSSKETYASTWLNVLVDDDGNITAPAIQVGLRLYTSSNEKVVQFTSVIDTIEAATMVSQMILAAQELTNLDGLKREIVIPIEKLFPIDDRGDID